MDFITCLFSFDRAMTVELLVPPKKFSLGMTQSQEIHQVTGPFTKIQLMLSVRL